MRNTRLILTLPIVHFCSRRVLFPPVNLPLRRNDILQTLAGPHYDGLEPSVVDKSVAEHHWVAIEEIDDYFQDASFAAYLKQVL